MIFALVQILSVIFYCPQDICMVKENVFTFSCQRKRLNKFTLITSVTRVPLIGDYWVYTAFRTKLWRGCGQTFLNEQQQGLMAVLYHASHDGDERGQGEASRFSRAREVIQGRQRCITTRAVSSMFSGKAKLLNRTFYAALDFPIWLHHEQQHYASALIQCHKVMDHFLSIHVVQQVVRKLLLEVTHTIHKFNVEHQTCLTVCIKHWFIDPWVPVFGPV